MGYKPCNRCGQDIGFRKEGGRTIPINPDGSPHHCTPAPAEKPAEPDTLIGIYQGITFKRISITRKDKRILSSGCTADLLKVLSDPANQIKVGMKVKVTFDKDGNAEKIEICPDQPVAEPQPETQKETPCTSPESLPISTPPPAQVPPAAAAKPGAADIFPPKDRLIVAQCLLKAWTDLYVSGHPGEAYNPDNFVAAREEILAAIEKDLPRVMAMGVR